MDNSQNKMGIKRLNPVAIVKSLFFIVMSPTGKTDRQHAPFPLGSPFMTLIKLLQFRRFVAK